MKRDRPWLLILVIGFLWTCARAGQAAADRPEMLRSLVSTPAADVPARAADFAARQPEEATLLALDLLFYRWANWAINLDPEIKSLDQIIAALVTGIGDPAAAWAAANLRPGEPIRAVAWEPEDNRIRLLIEAGQRLRDAIKDTDTYPTRSIESLGRCAAALNDLKLDLSWAFVTTRLAERQLYTIRRHREAESAYENAHPVFSAYDLRAQAARIFDDLGHLHDEAGRYGDAESNYKLSGREWKAVGRGDLAGKQFINAGSALAAAGKPELALQKMLYGLDLSRKHAYSSGAYAAHAQLLLQVAAFYSSRASFAEAQELLREAEQMGKRAADPFLVSLVLREQAAAWRSAGQEPRARGCLTAREALLSPIAQAGSQAAVRLSDRSLPASEQPGLLDAVEKGASAATELGRHQQAVELLKQADAAYQSLRRDDDRTRVMRSLAAQYDSLGERQNSIIARREAAQLARGMGKDALAADILRDIERSAMETGDHATAIEAMRESVPVIEDSGNRLALADALASRGTLLAAMEQTAEAIRDLSRSAAIYTAELGEPWSPARVLAGLADVQTKAGKPGDAIGSLLAAVGRIEEWASTEGVDLNGEPRHAETLYGLYLQLVGLQISEGLKADAAKQVARGRRYSWYERLRSLLTASGDPTAAAVLKQVDAMPAEPRVASPRAAPGAPRKVASSWPAVLTQAAPFSISARGGRNPGRGLPVDASEIYKVRDRLPDGLALVEYAVADSDVHALVASRRAVSCWELPASADKVRDAVSAFRKAVAEMENRVAAGTPVPPVRNLTDPSLLPMLDPLFDLAKMLFEPLRKDLSQITTIAFALPEDLTGVPFHAFPLERLGSLRFVIQDYAVSYVGRDMLALLVAPNARRINPKTDRIAIFADSSGALSGATSEARRVQLLYPHNKIYTGADATAERFVRAALSSGIVHIAAHHQADPNPARFSITLGGRQGGPGIVRLGDLLRITNPNLKLAVLSACETVGTSDAVGAAAPYTAEYFALAGFPTVVGGLWKVSDKASADLMVGFHRYLTSKGRKAEALRLAQKSMIESRDGKYAHPFYWATFALYGDPR